MEIELTQIESDWLRTFDAHFAKLPSGLSLRINNLSSWGNVEVFSKEGGHFTRGNNAWIEKAKAIIANIPMTPEFWMLSNIDGLHIGKGYPTVISKSSYGASGACSSYSDNFHEYYHTTISVDYGEIDEDEYDVCETAELSTNHGDFKTWEHGDFAKVLR